MNASNERQARIPPRPLIQRIGAILWPSFFAAGVATMVLFAFVDPVELAAISFPDITISREQGYSIAFFGFWIGFASACTTTWLLLRPAGRFHESTPDQPRTTRSSSP